MQLSDLLGIEIIYYVIIRFIMIYYAIKMIYYAIIRIIRFCK